MRQPSLAPPELSYFHIFQISSHISLRLWAKHSTVWFYLKRGNSCSWLLIISTQICTNMFSQWICLCISRRKLWRVSGIFMARHFLCDGILTIYLSIYLSIYLTMYLPTYLVIYTFPRLQKLSKTPGRKSIFLTENPWFGDFNFWYLATAYINARIAESCPQYFVFVFEERFYF